MSNNEVKDLTTQELLTKDNYIIPIYQRNYAWGEEQITQLIQDIWDYAQKVKDNEEGKQPYYIGTLVTHFREKDKKYEVLDGQQRLTTLYILCAVLKHLKQTVPTQNLNLHFEAREESSQTLKNILDGRLEGEQPSIIEGFDTAKKCFLNTYDQIDLSKFTTYFLNQVILVRTIVPENTDLNHYFEIMNNRGEQLEKHEILKARLLEKIDSNLQAKYAKIWEACSQMNTYVQMNFSTDDRTTLFSDDRNTLSVDKIQNYLKPQDGETTQKNTTGNENTIANILEKKTRGESTEENGNDEAESFESIIDFPNFLLQVLKVTNADVSVSLDDKKLLDEFSKLPENKSEDFIKNLLQYRLWFDQNIIKRENNEKWILKPLEADESEENANNKENKNILMIQSMFQVSFPEKSNKIWLQSILRECYSEGVTVEKLEKIANERLGEVSICSLHYNDNRPPIFLFHLMDYLIWKENQKDEITESYKIEKLSEFSFKFRNSIEHFYPQNPQNGENLEETLHSFGNLALTTRSQNSKWSNFLPKDKLEYLGAKEEKSLKFQLMMQKANAENQKWNQGAIETHQAAMSKLLEYFHSEKISN